MYSASSSEIGIPLTVRSWEYERKDPIPKAQDYFDWVTKKNSKRQSERTAKSKV